MPDDSPASEKLEASGVSIKIPPFWTDKPEIWFYQVEDQFQICKITSEDTKFNYLVAQLEPRFLENIWDIIKDSSVNKYSTAKERLLTTFEENENKIKRLIIGLELGDMMPSQILRNMRSLGEPYISENVLRTLWLEKMPDTVKSIVIVNEESLEKLAAMADKIVEMNPRAAVFSGILILSAYNIVPGKKRFWENASDLRNDLVYNARRRDRFVQIMKYMHCADNTKINLN
ncbi:hypothetical protein AVEN_34387-1 [Araneus ventricosus]|uniref:Uncharacterized protein n=1 Tax=Araneus ventricosus TaxID=182803 RepID=A0A4Y2G2L6_ARAVE|nr:hypothetical protein AVEN_34387-1 [Araneus ventricosus]